MKSVVWVIYQKEALCRHGNGREIEPTETKNHSDNARNQFRHLSNPFKGELTLYMQTWFYSYLTPTARQSSDEIPTKFRRAQK